MRVKYLATVVLMVAATAPLAAIAAPGRGALMIAESKAKQLELLDVTHAVAAETVSLRFDLGKLEVLTAEKSAAVPASSPAPAIARPVDVTERKPVAFHLRL